ncbi:uncharacterized protein [Zea mays]|uniref:uncharacterized protein n=1 Tax=Zea mays TaxID=4577 RepID=UPI001651E107|nr:uncharacterized protein LOC118476087 [Zea mays]
MQAQPRQGLSLGAALSQAAIGQGGHEPQHVSQAALGGAAAPVLGSDARGVGLWRRGRPPVRRARPPAGAALATEASARSPGSRAWLLDGARAQPLAEPTGTQPRRGTSAA